jgi:hypothetical protein
MEAVSCAWMLELEMLMGAWYEVRGGSVFLPNDAKTAQSFPGIISSTVGRTLSTLVSRPNSRCRECRAICRLSSGRRKDTFQYR